MHGRLWKWASALLAAICGVAFGLFAGMGMVRAAELPRAVVPLLAGSAAVLAWRAVDAQGRHSGLHLPLPSRNGVACLPPRRPEG